jgi:large conductance mechanosensitive channel
MAIIAEFKKFIARGNVLDLAVGVIIGAAFGRIVSSLTDNVIMPVVGWIAGNLDFSNYFIRLGPIPPGYRGELNNYNQLKEAGVAMIGYGQLITAIVNFLIVAWILFLLIKAVNALVDRQKEDEAKQREAKGPSEVELLAQIRDELRNRGEAPPPPVTSH